MFSPTDFRTLFQPNYCERRVWLTAKRPDLALEEVEFNSLIRDKGVAVENAHVETIGPVEIPVYPVGDLSLGFEETIKLIEAKASIIYQGVLQSKDGQFRAIPDLMIFDEATNRYKIRDVKLAKNLDNHPEILIGLGLCQIIGKDVFGYLPLIEVINGDGQLISPLDVPDKDETLQYIDRITSLENLDEEPMEPLGWSKCNPCPYFEYCWHLAWESQNICAVSGLEQGMAKALWANRVTTWDDILNIGLEKLSDTYFQRGSQTQRIGMTRADKIYGQVKSLVNNVHEVKQPIIFPHGYSKGQRPLVIFDLENNIFEDLGIQVDVYLWGLMTVSNGDQKQELIISPAGENGDYIGWQQFLTAMSQIFKRYGDIPIIHYSPHEKTWVSNYIRRHGDQDGVGQRILDNLWDLYKMVTSCVILPVPSYGLKQLEKFIGFKRSQEEYGGSWSIVRYNQYLQTALKEDAEIILNEIRLYNGEDLQATYTLYKWIEDHCC